MASASAASSDSGAAFGSSTPIIMRICALSPWPAPTTVFFTKFGAYSATVSPARAGTSIATPRAWPSFKVAAAFAFTKVCSTAASCGVYRSITASSPSWIASRRSLKLARSLVARDPQEAAVEATFVNANAAATLKLGQARGIAMLVPARAGLSVAEYAPNVVKKSIVGAGHGEKAQIRMMIGVLLPKADPQSEDAADALAIAVTHAHHRSSILLKVAAS